MFSAGGDSDDDDGTHDTFFDALAGDSAEESVLGVVVVRPSSPAPPTQPHRASSTFITVPSSTSSRKLPRGRTVDRQSALPATTPPRSPAQHSPRLELVPKVPRIPTRFLGSGRPVSITALPRPLSSPLALPPRRAFSVTSAVRRRLSTDAEEGPDTKPRPARELLPSHRESGNGVVEVLAIPTAKQSTDEVAHSPPPPSPKPSSPTVGPGATRSAAFPARRKSLPAQVHQATLDLLEAPRASNTSPTDPMARQSRARRDHSFLDLGQDLPGDNHRPASRSGDIASSLSHAAKRRSMPAESALAAAMERRPRAQPSNVTGRPSSRLGSDDLQRHVEHYRTPPSMLTRDEDARSMSGRSQTGSGNHFYNITNRTNTGSSRLASRFQSPECSGRRSSLGVAALQRQPLRLATLPSSKEQDSQDESPAESSEPKPSIPDSASDDSQTADTVWDELDDLKLRIKNLELTGKLPPTSNVAASDESMERPRTATTAPTTIDSSPKHERQPQARTTEPPAAEHTLVTPSVADIHPLLHSALAKAKSLLHPVLYRSLEATVNDALGMASMAGGVGSSRVTFPTASIVSSTTASDRHIKRKADTMCRNLTDLCLALCDGKNEPVSAQGSPLASKLPTIRYSRSTIGNDGNVGRPMSRLEARRSSILGSDADSGFGLSPRAVGGEDISGSDQETPLSQRQELRRVSRASSRLGQTRPRHDEVSGDEDTTLRPRSRSRAVTEASQLHVSSGRTRDSSSRVPQRSPSLRESLITRRANNAGAPPDTTRLLSRVASMPVNSGRRRHTEHSVTPVVEEDDDEGNDYPPITQPKRQVSSFAGGQYRLSQRTDTRPHGRAPSLSQRRHIAIE